MNDVFENLRNWLNKKDKTNTNYKRPNKADMEDSSLCSLLDYQEKQNYKFSKKKAKAENDSIKLSMLNPIYTTINLSLIIILISLKINNQIQLKNDKMLYNIIVPSYYDLYIVNPIIFHLYKSIEGLIGFCIVYVLYSTANLKIEYIRDKSFSSQLKLIFLLMFGLIFNLTAIIEAFIPYLNLNNVDMIFFYETLFIISVFSICLFAVLLLWIISGLKESFEESNSSLVIKVVLLVYLLVFSILYIAILLNKYKVIELTVSLGVIRNRYEYAISLVPYVIKFFSSMLILSFYDGMKSVYLGISVSKFEEDEKFLV